MIRKICRYDNVVLILMSVAMFYSSYRYPFMINASGTSETYSDTPLSLQLGKYIIFVMIFTVIAINKLIATREIVFKFPLKCMLYFYLFITPVIYGLIVSSMVLVQSGFFVAIPLVLHTYPRAKLNYEILAKFMSFCVYLAILVNVIQIVLAITIGRMPALAYKGTILIRFGSFLDDPNGFGILL